MTYKISWVRYDEYHEKVMDSREDAERLQNFLAAQGFYSMIKEIRAGEKDEPTELTIIQKLPVPIQDHMNRLEDFVEALREFRDSYSESTKLDREEKKDRTMEITLEEKQ